jgi:hypothetical protein
VQELSSTRTSLTASHSTALTALRSELSAANLSLSSSQQQYKDMVSAWAVEKQATAARHAREWAQHKSEWEACHDRMVAQLKDGERERRLSEQRSAEQLKDAMQSLHALREQSDREQAQHSTLAAAWKQELEQAQSELKREQKQAYVSACFDMIQC